MLFSRRVDAGPTRVIRLLGLLASLSFVLLWSAPSHAYPWMIRHGFAKCASCHTDPMGGETLTGFGRVMGDTTLAMTYGRTVPSNAAMLFYGIEEPDSLRLGGSLRYMTFLYEFPKNGQDGKWRSFPMQIDAYGQAQFGKFRVAGSLGVAKVPAGSPHARAAQITSANDGDQLNLISRNHWVGYDIADGMLIRAGRINLPFGIRLPEHVMWVRDQTRTDRESDQQHGIAFSYSRERIRGEIMGIAGNYQIKPDKFRERGYSLYGEYLLTPTIGVGVSSLVTRAESDRLLVTPDPYVRQAHGLTGRVSFIEPLVLLAEADVLLASKTGTGYVGMLQADYELIQGLHLMGTGEVLDAGQRDGAESATGAGEPAFGGWLSVNWFFFTHFDWRLDLVARQEQPVSVQSQVHFYF